MDKFVLNIIHRPELSPEYAEKVTGQGKKEDISRKGLLDESLEIFKLQQQIAQIKILNERNRVLLERNRQFAAFSINVITQASAETTYVPPGNSGVQAAKRVKMFDKSI